MSDLSRVADAMERFAGAMERVAAAAEKQVVVAEGEARVRADSVAAQREMRRQTDPLMEMMMRVVRDMGGEPE